MTTEEIAREIGNAPITAIATGLLNRNAFDSLEIDSMKITNDERRKQVGARIRMIRKLLGLTQEQLAQRIGVTKQAITTYETGRREAGYRNLIGLSRTLGVSVDWLLGEEY